MIKHTEDSLMQVSQAPRSGIYKMDPEGRISFDRMDTHRRAVELDSEAFFLRISRKDDYFYEGADMGILVMRGRLMTDDFKLRPRAEKWINAIKSMYKAEPLAPTAPKHAEIGGFKFV